MEYKLKTLKNNLKTLFINSPGRTNSSVQLWFRAGSALEDKKDFGIAHFLEHMFFKGTPTRPGPVMAHQIESLGGEFNAFTSFDYTCYYVNIPNKDIDLAANILLDMVSNPTFKEEDLIPERGVVFEEFRRSLDSPNQYAFHQLQENCFQGSYQHQILGTEKNIKNFSREQLVNFRNNFYSTENCMMILAGDIESKQQELESIINNYKIPKGKKSSFPNFNLKKKSSISVHQKDTTMMQLYMAIEAPDFSKPEAVYEDLAINALGHGETSMLYKNLVLDNASANNVDGSTMFMNKGGVHFLSLSFPQENIGTVFKKLHNTIKDSLGNLQEKEIDRIKNQYIASKVFEKESLDSFAFSLGQNFALTENLRADDEFLDRIKKANYGDINQCLYQIFNRAIHFSLQIPKTANKKKAETELNKLALNFKKLKDLDKGIAKYKITNSKHDSSLKLVEIKKGIQLLYKQNKTSPTFVLQSYIKSGLSLEKDSNNGIHYLISRSITKGHSDISFQDLKEELEHNSISLTGYAGKNSYGVVTHAQSDHQSLAIKHFMGSLLRPNFKANFVNHDIKITKRILDNQKENPSFHCFNTASKFHFNKHPYSRATQGTKKSLASMNRKSLTDFHQKNLRSKEILLTYCGDRELSEVIYLIDKEIQSLKPRTKINQKFNNKIDPLLGQKKHIHLNREQVQILVSTQTDSFNSKEYLYLKILTAHLSGQSSDLFVEMRDKRGLCYTAQPIHFAALEAGYWGIYMASGSDKAQEALVAIKELIEKLKKNGLDEDEFNRIKLMLEGQELLSLQTNEDYANSFSIPVIHNLGIDNYFKGNEQIRTMKYSSFQRGIKTILNRPWNNITVGNL